MVMVTMAIIFWVADIIQIFMVTITIFSAQRFSWSGNVGWNIFLVQKYFRVTFNFFASSKKHSFVSEPASNIKLFAFCPSFQLC